MLAQVARCRLPRAGIDREQDREHATADEVGEEVAPEVRWGRVRAAVDDAAGDRVADATWLIRVQVVVDGRRGRRVGQGPRSHAGARALEVAPAVVAAARARRLVVDFLARALTDIGDQHRAGAAEARIVERELPGIAQPECPDLGPRGDRHAVDEGVVAGDAHAVDVAGFDVDVDAEHLPEQRGRILRAMLRIVAAAAVAHPDVEVAVGAEASVPPLWFA